MLGRIIGSVRRNHALEHATVSVLLSRMGPNVRLVGRAVSDGFYIYSTSLKPDQLESAAEEALDRMQAGESHLAVSPLCGTNLAVGGSLAGLAAMLAVGSGDRWERMPNVLTAAMLAVMAGQPLGRLAQKYLTTSPDLKATSITGLREGGNGRGRYIKIETSRT
jgi:hypothetical protein